MHASDACLKVLRALRGAVNVIFVFLAPFRGRGRVFCSCRVDACGTLDRACQRLAGLHVCPDFLLAG